jgi:predicted DNA-binding transcriptional regulator YafY
MDKQHRLNIITHRLFAGETIRPSILAKQLGVTDRMILNDIKELRDKYQYEIVSPKKGYYKLKEVPSYMEEEIKELVENLVYSLAYHSLKGLENEIQELYKKEFLVEFDIELEEIKDIDMFKELLQAIKWNYSIEIKTDKKMVFHPLKIVNHQFKWYLVGVNLHSNQIEKVPIREIENFYILYENLYRSVK